MGYLRVRNIGKAYKRYPSKWARLAEWISGRQWHEKHWVLRDISFEISAGEAVGIIGVNGAGKSTLLKIIAGTTQPTTGSIEVGGQIAALLELGMGFHPNFTGRQNAYMSGQIRGLSTDRISDLMPEIEAFAEIGDYLDQPLRTYSSGMQVRLAFSVATAIRPDILIVDEALSVGDSYFQHKSIDRIRKFRDEGTTLLFVSHSPGAIKTLCNRALLIDSGILQRDDHPDSALDYYNAVIAKQNADYEIRQIELATKKKMTRSGNGKAKIEIVDLLHEDKSVRAIQSGDSAVFSVLVISQDYIEELTVGILIRDRLGNDVFGTNTFYHEASMTSIVAETRIQVRFFFENLYIGVGSYSIAVALHDRDTHVSSNYDWWDKALVFQVVPGKLPRSVGINAMPVLIEKLIYP
ncbi:MAG: ABC transporter ATP-binding protein [Candidatus Competibacter sp.]